MSSVAKQISIFSGLFLVYSTYNIIYPFYPRVAKGKGLPFWLIGLIFSLKAVTIIIISPILGKHMNKLGRKNIMISSFIFTSASMGLLSPIEYCEKSTVIILSIFALICEGLGAGTILNSTTTIFTSDYPDKVQTMMGRMEAAIGLGLIIGPVLGTALSQVSLFFTFMTMCITHLIFAFIVWKPLGTFRPYEIRASSISKMSLLFKPRIFLTLLMNTSFLFSFGLVETILEIHLSSFNIGRLYISLCFVLQSAVYLISCLTIGYIFKSIDERLIMIVGTTMLAIAYLMLGPWGVIFPRKVVIIILALPLISAGQSFTYSNFYEVSTIPFMIKSASFDYNYANDDKLSDTISSVAVWAGACGDIIGPIYAGIVSGAIGIESCCAIASIATFVFAIVYAIGCGYFCKNKKYQIVAA